MKVVQQQKLNHVLWRGIALAFLTVFLFPCFADSQPTNSGAASDNYMAQVRKIWSEYNSDGSTNSADKLFHAGWNLQKNNPNEINGYQIMMAAVNHGADTNPEKARAWADKLLKDSSTPEQFKLRLNGFLYRLDSQGKPINLKFKAADGREVDLEQMRGKVVLIDFWATWCGPCRAELPRVKAAFEKYQQQGFEVVGISCDEDKDRLNAYLKEKKISWPQYFDGQTQAQNKIAQKFGINGIPHMFFVDKMGCLRFDDVRALGEKKNFEEKIDALLSEK